MYTPGTHCIVYLDILPSMMNVMPVCTRGVTIPRFIAAIVVSIEKNDYQFMFLNYRFKERSVCFGFIPISQLEPEL